MTASTPPTPAHFRDDQTSREALAEEIHAPLDEVSRLYDEELSALAAGAKITQFLGVLASRRVRMKLRGH